MLFSTADSFLHQTLSWLISYSEPDALQTQYVDSFLCECRASRVSLVRDVLQNVFWSSSPKCPLAQPYIYIELCSLFTRHLHWGKRSFLMCSLNQKEKRHKQLPSCFRIYWSRVGQSLTIRPWYWHGWPRWCTNVSSWTMTQSYCAILPAPPYEGKKSQKNIVGFRITARQYG